MYAIIRTGGKQYKVEAGDEILVEKLDAEVGAEVAFEAFDALWRRGRSWQARSRGRYRQGNRCRSGQGQRRSIVFHYQAQEANIRKKQGHRQPYTKVKIESIG